MSRRSRKPRPKALAPKPPSPSPRLTPEIIADDSRLLGLVDQLFEHDDNYKKHTRRILAAQHRLQDLCSEEAWVRFLFVEEAANLRVNMMLAVVARWAFDEGRGHRRPRRS